MKCGKLQQSPQVSAKGRPSSAKAQVADLHSQLADANLEVPRSKKWSKQFQKGRPTAMIFICVFINVYHDQNFGHGYWSELVSTSDFGQLLSRSKGFRTSETKQRPTASCNVPWLPPPRCGAREFFHLFWALNGAKKNEKNGRSVMICWLVIVIVTDPIVIEFINLTQLWLTYLFHKSLPCFLFLILWSGFWFGLNIPSIFFDL